jgi:hypothetical protein
MVRTQGGSTDMHPDIERGQKQTADRLRALPTDAQPPYDWLEFQRRTQSAGATGEGRRFAGLPYMAGAAVLVLMAVGSIALMSHSRGIRVAGRITPPTVTRLVHEDPARIADARTQATERWLASLPSEPVIVRFGTRLAVSSLEDRIAQVDDLLTAANFGDVQPARLAALQQERGRLVNSLAQVRYAEVLAANAP